MPSARASSARFGCWTCTVIQKDCSLESFVDTDHAEFEQRLDFWAGWRRSATTLRKSRHTGGTGR